MISTIEGRLDMFVQFFTLLLLPLEDDISISSVCATTACCHCVESPNFLWWFLNLTIVYLSLACTKMSHNPIFFISIFWHELTMTLISFLSCWFLLEKLSWLEKFWKIISWVFKNFFIIHATLTDCVVALPMAYFRLNSYREWLNFLSVKGSIVAT